MDKAARQTSENPRMLDLVGLQQGDGEGQGRMEAAVGFVSASQKKVGK